MGNLLDEIFFSCCGCIERKEKKEKKEKELRDVSSIELRQMLDDVLSLDLERSLKDLPSHFFCPLSNEFLSDPVLVPNSPNSFTVCDAIFIEQWLTNHHSNPFNREKLEIEDLKIDKALKEEIYDFLLDELSLFEEQAARGERPRL